MVGFRGQVPTAPPAAGKTIILEQVGRLLGRATGFLKDARPADAVPLLREASRLQPLNALIQHDLGLALLETGGLEESIGAFRLAIASKPRYADAHFRLGIALEKLGDFGGAVRAYDRATELAPSLAEAWFRAGALVYTMGHRKEAIGCFRRAESTGRKSRFGRLGAARALLAEERDEEAEKVLRQTLAADPASAMAHDLLGALLAEHGRFHEAYDCFARAVALSPLMAGSWYDLVRCRPVMPAEQNLIAQMESALATPGLEAAQRLRVRLALGKAADDLGDYALAMRHLDAADAVRRALAPFDATAFDEGIDRLIDLGSPGMMARAAELGDGDERPVLIVGMPRSGTTLVEQILSSHPEVAGGGELNFWNERGPRWRAAGPAATAAPFLRPFLSEAAAGYLGVLGAIGPRAARVTDKMPFNFLWAGLIHLAFPRATIIHCRRAAIDTALSIHQTLFHPGLAFPTGGEELVAYFRSYRRLTDHWRRVLPPDRFVEVDYEDLTRAPEPAIRRIVAACGLAWDDACLRPERNPRAVKTPSKWQTRQPIYRSSVERWRRYQPWLGPLRALVDDGFQAAGATRPGGGGEAG